MVLNVVVPVYRCFLDGANKRQLVVGTSRGHALHNDKDMLVILNIDVVGTTRLATLI